MKEDFFYAVCPFETGDMVKIIIQEEPLTLSDETYTIDDILTIRSYKHQYTIFKIILEGEKKARNVRSLKMVKEHE